MTLLAQAQRANNMNHIQNEDLIFETSIILINARDTDEGHKSSIKEKLEKIAKLSRENEELRKKLENLQTRSTMAMHPYLVEFFNARILNLELLEAGLVNKKFKRKEREKIIELIIQGAYEIWHLGEVRAARFLKDYLHVEKDEDTKRNSHQSHQSESFRFDEQELKKNIPKKTEISNELKQLYRKLVKLLHPDREMDEEKKLEKNLLMKKVIEAYEKEDLHTLLLIMAEISGHEEHLEGKLETYIKALNKKLKDLKDEKLFIMKWGPLAEVYQSLYSRNPKKVEAKIRAQIQEIQDRIDKEEFFGDIYSDDLYLKAFLKEIMQYAYTDDE